MTGHSGEPAPGRPEFPPERSPAPGGQDDQGTPRPDSERADDVRQSAGQAGGQRDQILSLLAYLGFFLLIPPLVVSVASGRRSPFVRYHATQALNLWITAFGYTLSCLILGVVLALDTTGTALAVGVPLACLVWAAAVAYAIVGGVSASRGRLRRLPAWVCSPIVK